MKTIAILAALLMTTQAAHAWKWDGRPPQALTEAYADVDDDGNEDWVRACQPQWVPHLCEMGELLVLTGEHSGEPFPVNTFCGAPIQFQFAHNVDLAAGEQLPPAYDLYIDGEFAARYWRPTQLAEAQAGYVLSNEAFNLFCALETCTIADLKFEWPGGFGRWSVKSLNGELSQERDFDCPEV